MHFSHHVRALISTTPLPTPYALPATEFCRSLKFSRSVFYKIRDQAASETAAALHPRSRAPKHPPRRYAPNVVNELVKIRKQLKLDGWDYGPRTICLRATIQETSPGGMVPPVATNRVPSVATKLFPAVRARPQYA
jgi:hypothetical protein